VQRPSSTSERSEKHPLVLLSEEGDEIEQAWWPQLHQYISRYETIWQMHVEPLRSQNSIYLRDGVDEDFQIFAMNHYTTFVNLSRAFDKIERRSDDFKYAEEIWSNLQRAAEVTMKATEAFTKIYRTCTRAEPRINTAKLDAVHESIKVYRNLLHHPMRGTVKDAQGTRMIPRRDKMDKYFLWTTVMYHCDDSDFVSVETQLRDDFARLCSILQGLWSQIEDASHVLATNKEYVTRRAAGTRTAGTASTLSGSVLNPVAASGTVSFGVQGPVKKS
jgi:MFS superfamily sulfate permease-like transporter